MTQKSAAPKSLARQTDEHELLQQDDFGWLAEVRDALSPYWSSRVEYHPEKKVHVLALKGPRTSNG